MEVLTEGRPGGTTPVNLARCVVSVVSRPGFSPREGNTFSDKLSAAFAICIQSLRGAGQLTKKGAVKLTGKGKKREADRLGEPDTAKKMKAFERLLKKAKKERAAKKDSGRSEDEGTTAMLRAVGESK